METVAETVSNRSRNSAVVNAGEGWERDVISDIVSLTSVHVRHLLARTAATTTFAVRSSSAGTAVALARHRTANVHRLTICTSSWNEHQNKNKNNQYIYTVCTPFNIIEFFYHVSSWRVFLIKYNNVVDIRNNSLSVISLLHNILSLVSAHNIIDICIGFSDNLSTYVFYPHKVWLREVYDLFTYVYIQYIVFTIVHTFSAWIGLIWNRAGGGVLLLFKNILTFSF